MKETSEYISDSESVTIFGFVDIVQLKFTNVLFKEDKFKNSCSGTKRYNDIVTKR
jgi:hypothetical protein